MCLCTMCLKLIVVNAHYVHFILQLALPRITEDKTVQKNSFVSVQLASM